MKRGLLYRLKQVPHLFSKVVVLYCVAVASGTSLWACGSCHGQDTIRLACWR